MRKGRIWMTDKLDLDAIEKEWGEAQLALLATTFHRIEIEEPGICEDSLNKVCSNYEQVAAWEYIPLLIAAVRERDAEVERLNKIANEALDECCVKDGKIMRLESQIAKLKEKYEQVGINYLEASEELKRLKEQNRLLIEGCAECPGGDND